MQYHSLCPYKECRELQPGTQRVRNVHISIAQHVALFVDLNYLQAALWQVNSLAEGRIHRTVWSSLALHIAF